ncbi:MAG TPA: hypothetical protein VGN37_08325 [Actinocatenispora sp.]
MAAFQDFNFKLLVIDKLMYDDRTLTPPFSIDARMAERGIGDAQSYVLDHGLESTILDESRTHFEGVVIGEELLAGVTSLYVDGGSQVYFECCPAWDGEGDQFDVHSLDDLVLLPNLTRITGAHDCAILSPRLAEALVARGIATD